MPKVAPLQSSFNGGELSPLMYGRVETDRYKQALAICKNYIPTIQGGLVRRPGSYFVAEVKDSTKKVRLVNFEFSTTQAYVLEIGDQYIRFYMNNGQIESSPGVPYEVASPYLENEIFDLKVTQSADVLYLVHPNHRPRKLSRTGHTSWTISNIEFQDGPYLNTNATTTTMICSAASGYVNITASAVTGINDGQGFLDSDIGRLVRIINGSNWSWLEITARTSTTVVTAYVKGGAAPTAATTSWRMGAWSVTTGYPSAITFFEDRLVLAGATASPQRVDGSKSGDYENFAPTELTSGTTTDAHAISFTLNANDVNVLRWLSSDEKGLTSGSVGGEWVVRASSAGEALSPTNVSAKRTNAYGSANIQPVQVGKATIFVQRAGKKLREFSYFYDVDGFRAEDLTMLSEHITGPGLTQLAYQKEPQSLVWCVRSDGVLAAMTYDRDIEALKAGWSRHILGGESDAAGTHAKVESVAVIPSADGTRDEVWLVVQRHINGATKRYVEYLTKIFDDLDAQQDAFFVDSGLTLDSPLTITGVTKANPAVVTATAHGFANGDRIRISEVAGMTELNNNSYTVANATANTFELSGIDSSAYTTYISGGEARKLVTTISGLSHLEGQEVAILTDGAVHPNRTVSSGAITLQHGASVVHVGLGFSSDGQLLRLEAGAADGTALGKTRRTHRVGMLIHRTLGLKIGTNFVDMDTVTFRKTSDSMSRAPALYSGILSETITSDYDFENQVSWRQDQPLPGMILAVMPQMVTQDR